LFFRQSKQLRLGPGSRLIDSHFLFGCKTRCIEWRWRRSAPLLYGSRSVSMGVDEQWLNLYCPGRQWHLIGFRSQSPVFESRALRPLHPHGGTAHCGSLIGPIQCRRRQIKNKLANKYLTMTGCDEHFVRPKKMEKRVGIENVSTEWYSCWYYAWITVIQSTKHFRIIILDLILVN